MHKRRIKTREKTDHRFRFLINYIKNYTSLQRRPLYTYTKEDIICSTEHNKIITCQNISCTTLMRNDWGTHVYILSHMPIRVMAIKPLFAINNEAENIKKLGTLVFSRISHRRCSFIWSEQCKSLLANLINNDINNKMFKGEYLAIIMPRSEFQTFLRMSLYFCGWTCVLFIALLSCYRH